jgi:RNA polymerase sigma-70 factor (ECF subfamily)
MAGGLPVPDPTETTAPTPTSWLERLTRREGPALDRVVAEHTEDLQRAAQRLGFGASDADDVVHATWETFLRIVGEFRGDAQVRTFLRGILWKKAAEFRRTTRCHKADPLDEAEPTAASSGPDPEEVARDAEARERLDECLGALPQRERLVVTHRVLNEEHGEEVARRLQVSAEHLRVLLHRARHHLRDCMHSGGH